MIRWIWIAVCCHLLATPSIAQSRKHILEEHHKAHTQAFWDQTRSAEIKGAWVGPQGYLKMTLWAKKPNKIAVFGHWQKKRFVTAYDGQRAWTIAPWTGYEKSQLMTRTEEIVVKSIFDFGSPIVDSPELEYKGKIHIDEVHCYWFTETKFNQEWEYFVEVRNHLLYKVSLKEYYGQDVLNMSKTFDLYRDFGGVILPSVVEIRSNESEAEFTFDEVILGLGMPSTSFQRPNEEN
ncbi:MAG: hypothetical protein KI790_10880 [Cyclobacteriaceae bacterium]|nr:hypothetical protein [Cyclobacteriaceae bacterium HetDA_MAG_MS6]